MGSVSRSKNTSALRLGGGLFQMERTPSSFAWDSSPSSLIAVASLDKLPSVIDTLITAVRNGELDEQLAHAAKQATPKKPRKAS
jgi:hypothetical protein